MEVIRQIKARLSNGAPAGEGEAGRTLRWFDYFAEYFLDTPDEEEDILYFVRLHSNPDDADERHPPLFVQRKVGSAVPRLEGQVNWEETFYVNLISKLLRYQVRLVILEGERVLTATQASVYAEPNRHDPKQVHCSYPMIYFASHGSDLQPLALAPGQSLCVELCSLLAPPPPPIPAGMQYEAWGVDDTMQVLFQGAVSYEALLKVHAKKAGLRPAQPQKVLMRGPGGHGHAQIRVANLDAQSRGSLHANFARIARVGSDHHRGGGEAATAAAILVECRFDFIHLHWRLIIMDHFRHPQSNLPPCGGAA